MKRKQWLAVAMSALITMSSFPVYATSMGNKESMGEEQAAEEQDDSILEMQAEEDGTAIPEMNTPETSAAEVLVETESEYITEELAETETASEQTTEEPAETESEQITEELTEKETESDRGTEESSEEATESEEETKSEEETESNIASGVYENITWVIDADGKLTVTGTGEFASSPENKNAYWTRAPWYEKRERIVAAEIDVTGIQDAGCMFRECSNLKSITFKNFDTSQTTTMECMFYNCKSLEKLDLSGFHTDHVVNMAYMFADCRNLIDLNVRSFNTGQVTEIDGMFQECMRLRNLDLSSFSLNNVKKADNVFAASTKLNVIQTPKNVVTPILLPASRGYSWYHNNMEITVLPQNQSSSISVIKGSSKPHTTRPITPRIITTKLQSAVQNVPYESVLQNNGWSGATYKLSSGTLPEGICLGTDGKIYGITKETGEFQFTVNMTVKDSPLIDEKTLTLVVLNSTDSVVDAIDEPGYEITQPIPDVSVEKKITDELFISKGPFNEFRDAFLDGNKLTRDVDYTAESGSTRITIKAETLDRLEKGKHTLGVEFRTEKGSMKRVAQNFNVNNKKMNSSQDSDHESSSSDKKQTSTNYTSGLVTARSKTELITEDNIYYSVYLPHEDALLRLALFHKVYGDNATVLAYLDNGIGYNLNLNAFLFAGHDLDLSTEEIKLAGFAPNFKSILLSMKQKSDLTYGLGMNLYVGPEYANHQTYVYIFDDLAQSFVPYTETVVAANGNVGFYTQRLTDFIVMVAE